MTVPPMRKSPRLPLRHLPICDIPRHARATSSLASAVQGARKRPCIRRLGSSKQVRKLANVRDDRILPDVWFTGSTSKAQDPFGLQGRGPEKEQPPDERTLKLGKSKLIVMICLNSSSWRPTLETLTETNTDHTLCNSYIYSAYSSTGSTIVAITT